MNQLETALKQTLGETALTAEELRRKRMRESNERRFREIEQEEKVRAEQRKRSAAS